MEIKLLEIKSSTKVKIECGQDVYEIMREEAKADRECSWVLHLNTQFCVIEKELVGIGVLDRVYCNPREIFRKAVVNCSKSIIHVHNHPSGSPIPSEEDIEVFQILTESGKLLGIEIVDCIIIGNNSHYSFFQARQSQGIKRYSGQIELFSYFDTPCSNCGDWIKSEDLSRVNGNYFCPYCCEVCFGKKSESWPSGFSIESIS